MTKDKPSKSGKPTACFPGDLSRKELTMANEGIKLSTVKLDWKEVYYTNCPLDAFICHGQFLSG